MSQNVHESSPRFGEMWYFIAKVSTCDMHETSRNRTWVWPRMRSDVLNDSLSLRAASFQLPRKVRVYALGSVRVLNGESRSAKIACNGGKAIQNTFEYTHFLILLSKVLPLPGVSFSLASHKRVVGSNFAPPAQVLHGPCMVQGPRSSQIGPRNKVEHVENVEGKVVAQLISIVIVYDCVKYVQWTLYLWLNDILQHSANGWKVMKEPRIPLRASGSMVERIPSSRAEGI